MSAAEEVPHLEGWVPFDVFADALGLTKARIHNIVFTPGPQRRDWINIKTDVRKVELLSGACWYLIRPEVVARVAKLHAEEKAAQEAARQERIRTERRND